jgi:polyisoprenoid-binding protein YceI
MMPGDTEYRADKHRIQRTSAKEEIMQNRSRAATPIVIAVLLAVLSPGTSRATTYKVDPSHTTVGFKIRHLFTNVTGRFDTFEGKIEFDMATPEATSVEGTIQAASINTSNEKRDNHLRGADFFATDTYPTITFKSTAVTDIDAKKKTAKLQGTLNMHGVEKEVVLDVAFLGSAKDPWGNTRAGFTATTTINRKDFGVNWNETLDSGGLLIGEEVAVEINVEGLVAQ